MTPRTIATVLLVFTAGRHYDGIVFGFSPGGNHPGKKSIVSGSGSSSPSSSMISPSSKTKAGLDVTSETRKLSQALQQSSTLSAPIIITGEEDAHYILNKAREVALSDDYDPEYDSHYHPYRDEDAKLQEMKFLLKEMMYLQSGCVTGEIMGRDICDNQDVAAEIVVKLRTKIDRLERRIAKRKG
jgi:hypothetical protein